jgi:3-oxoacyl-[acyl-carrier protein] reductase
MSNVSNGRVAVVTGASRGIGRAAALGLARDGFDLVLADLPAQQKALEAVCREIRAIGCAAYAHACDVSSRVQVQAMAEHAIKEAGHVDVVVNNAGILIPAAFENIEEGVWDAVLNVNAKGAFLVTQAFLPHMKERRYGRIVNIASIGGKHGAPEQAHYSASKAAIMGFTRVLAQEVGPFGITANCVCPGIIVTDMGRVNLDDKAVAQRWIDKTAMARLGQPEDVAGPVCFFASDNSTFVTGQSLNVCGGIVLS